MFENLSYLALQQYWWIIASLLAALLVFLMFVQGGQTLLGSVSTNDDEKTLLVNSLGRKWELTFTTLVTFGGAMFAAFPKFYATSFGGAYWAWIAILFCFTIQAVSYEYRRKKGNVWGRRTYDTFLHINGSLGVFLIGLAVGTFYTGSDFKLNADNQVIWQDPLRGIEAVVSLQNVLLGFAVYFLARVLGAMYFMNNIRDENIFENARKMVRFNAVPFLAVFVAFVALLLLKDGFTYDAASGQVFTEVHKYLHNFLAMPVVLILFLAGVILVLAGIYLSWLRKKKNGIWFAGSGTILAVFALFLVAGLNHTPFYPSASDPRSSLTIENASSSKYTLTVMSYVSLLVPFVLAYIFWVWRTLDRKKIDSEEIKNSEHLY
jgi:cytochrome bd ubiquinol oxidase subunit II